MPSQVYVRDRNSTSAYTEQLSVLITNKIENATSGNWEGDGLDDLRAKLEAAAEVCTVLAEALARQGLLTQSDVIQLLPDDVEFEGLKCGG